jgi:hypothetical protein
VDPWNSLDASIRSIGDQHLFKKCIENTARDQKPIDLSPFLKKLATSNNKMKRALPNRIKKP